MCKFLDKKKKKTLTEMTENTEAARLIRKRITKRRKMMEKSLTSVGYRNERNFSLYTPSPFHPTFFKNDRLRSFQFREKSHASC